MKTAKQTFEAYVREQCPELMELRFGCEVEYQFGDWYGERGIVTMECGKCTKHKLYKNCTMDCEHVDAVEVIDNKLEEPHSWIFEQDYDPPWYKVIGHPIQLHHVLRVLNGINYRFCVEPIEGGPKDAILLTHFGEPVGTGFLIPLTEPSQWPEKTYQKLCELLGLEEALQDNK